MNAWSCRRTRPGILAWVLIALILPSPGPSQAATDWRPAQGPLMTRWARNVSPTNVHPEYPRPQRVRKDWLNLNGLWDYSIRDAGESKPTEWQGRILVPFPVESALSGVMQQVGPGKRLWYRRSFTLPPSWNGRRTRLNFGAVDWETQVWINGVAQGQPHQGGYDSFTYDITRDLKPSGEQEIVVSVWDPSDAGHQPRGKQVQKPEAIWYTPTTGIWQTVWLEPVPETRVEDLVISPDLDAGAVTVTVVTRMAEDVDVHVEAYSGDQRVAAHTESGRGRNATFSPAIRLVIPQPRPWSPDDPHLYDLRITLSNATGKVDEVESYFGLRKIAVSRDENGINRLFLNNKPLFQFGPLDQGFWPDGLYTAPTDEALRYDIEVTRELGFNMIRKHVKVEPARWYYWCDKLGLLVWQDMPSGDNYIGRNDPDIVRTAESAARFESELRRMVEGLGNHPSIVMWVPYNEGWGQWDTARIAALVREWDPTRLVNSASGWTDRGVGDVHDIHVYPGPAAPPLEPNRAAVLGEFGGLGLPLPGHTWQDEMNWGYRSYTTRDELTDAYLKLIDQLHPLTGSGGLAAAVYTQTTDVEIEVNGLLTYDREVIKIDTHTLAAANRRLYTPPAPRQAQPDRLTPPATPLVACDPYFSIWSFSDQLHDDTTRHWTGRPHPLTALVRIDGETYRVMGHDPRRLPALPQVSLEVLPTRTIYRFDGSGIELTLTFMNASLPDDLDLLSRPVTYLTWEARSTDDQPRKVQLYFEASGELTVNEPSQPVTWAAESAGNLRVLKIGSQTQSILGKKGDDLRIDWGYLYIAAPASTVSTSAFAERRALQRSFANNGLGSVEGSTLSQPTPAEQLGAALAMDLGNVGATPVSRWLMIAYDDLYSIQYMKNNLRPYWRRNGWEATDLLAAAAREKDAITSRCVDFDRELMADLALAGGDRYARICALAFRQCFAANKFVADANGQPLSFSKENFSNGCIATSDVFYPMSPQFLLFGPSLAKSFLVPFMNYAASERWKFPFAPHDLGTYPHANGQVYGGGERTEENQMPVEESANLLILMAAVAQMEGHAGFATLYWPQLEKWAAYLKAKGFNPDNQLCTDDFAGHLAHNVNLSAKAICGLGAFAKLCALKGDSAQAAEYSRTATEFAMRWTAEADDGDHFRLAFDRPGTWSQKYNLVWDRILQLGFFPDVTLRKEMDHYLKVQNRYGLPLDNRADYTKLDWILWTATLTQSRSDFDSLVDPVYRWLNETPSRVPMTDWFDTKTGRKSGFQARPVVGGVFLQLLYDESVWKKYAGRERTQATNWAPLPRAPRIITVLPSAVDDAVSWSYTFEQPGPTWHAPDFDDSAWMEGPAGFGTRGTPGAIVRTEWKTSDIWLRRDFELPPRTSPDSLQLMIHHDEDAQVYLNGQLLVELRGFTTGYETVPLPLSARGAFRPGSNTLAIHCRQTGGGQYIDAGMVRVEAAVAP